jgi:hypothetical protein
MPRALRGPLSAPALLLGLFLFAPSSAEAQRPERHTVVVGLDEETGALTWSPDPVLVYRRDQIVFTAPGSDSLIVTFPEESPFRNRRIRVTGGQSPPIPVLPQAAFQSYKYDIALTVGGETYIQDPEIIVRDRRVR